MDNPRSLFSNDSVAVGMGRGRFVELAARDQRQGVIFYILEPHFCNMSLDRCLPAVRRATR